jgi:hypothetical protein
VRKRHQASRRWVNQDRGALFIGSASYAGMKQRRDHRYVSDKEKPGESSLIADDLALTGWRQGSVVFRKVIFPQENGVTHVE